MECLGKNLVENPGALCESCISLLTKNIKGIRGSDILGNLAGFWLLGGIAGVIGSLITQDYIVGVLSISATITAYSILGYSIRKTNLARILVKDEAEAAYYAEITRIENLIGLSSFDGGSTKHFGPYYVYLHYYPENNQVVYVGKGKNSRDQSEGRASQEHTRLLKEGKLKVHRILTMVNEQVAFEQEAYLIRLFGRKTHKGQLFNIQDGVRTPINHLPLLPAIKDPLKPITTSHRSCMLYNIDRYANTMERKQLSKEYQRKTLQHIRSISKELNWTNVSDITVTGLERCMQYKQVSENTKNKYYSSFSRFCSWLYKGKRIAVNPFARG